MEFLGLENSAIKKVSRDPSPSDSSKKFLNISILIALMMRNPNLSSEFLQHKVVQNYEGYKAKDTLKNRSEGYLVFALQILRKTWYNFCPMVKKS